MLGMLSESRSWDRSNEESEMAAIHHVRYPPCVTAMQQSNYYNLHSLSDSTASMPKVSADDHQPSSSSVAENGVGNHFETTPPPFIDFLGVGAT